MRNASFRVVSGAALVAAIASVACSSSSGGDGGGSGAGTGGSSSGASSSGSSGSGSGASSSGSTGSGSSGSGSDAGGLSVTTLDASRSLGSLTTAEAARLCADTFAYLAATIAKTTTCKWSALKQAASSSSPSDAMLQMFCSNNESACDQSDAGAAPMCDPLPSPCMATVGQYSACIRDEAAALVQTVKGFPSCAMLQRSNTSDIFTAEGADAPPSCTALSNACNGINPPNPLTM